MGCGTSVPEYILHDKPIRKTLCGDLILAVDKRTNNIVLMKRFSSLTMVSYESPTDELATLKLLQTIPHPNLVGLKQLPHNFDKGEYRDIAVLEYSTLGDLHKLIQKRGTGYPIKMVIKMSRQLLSGIEHLHTKLNIVHGDISCENILMFATNKSITCKLVDYGFSRHTYGLMDPRSKSHVIGKPAYLAPELRTYKQYDGYAVDIFAAGICMYSMLYGHFPFETTEQSNESWNQYNTIGLSELTKRYGHQTSCSKLLDLIECMLSENPDERPSASGALSMLNGIR